MSDLVTRNQASQKKSLPFNAKLQPTLVEGNMAAPTFVNLIALPSTTSIKVPGPSFSILTKNHFYIRPL